MRDAPPLSLYVHLPWCVRKCPYCDFNSHAAPAQLPQSAYVDALLRDLEVDLEWVRGRRLISVFFGGGTPSLFAPEEIARFIAGVRARIALEPDAEITLEVNPGAVERGRFGGYFAAGVNRISLGAQTFNPHHLQALGRIHRADETARAVEELRGAGFENFNLDLMYGLPQQRIAQALEDLETAFALQPTHISHYQLTLEPGTVFYHRPPPLPDGDEAWAMQAECQALLAAHGYGQYEVSAYARTGFRCRHNLNYWRFGDYLGLGAGAHGKITGVQPFTVRRTNRLRQPREYLSRLAPDRVERWTVAPQDLPFEFFLNALRLCDGFTAADFEACTGVSFQSVASQVAAAVQRGLLVAAASGEWIKTELGTRFLNDLQGAFLPDATPPDRAPVERKYAN